MREKIVKLLNWMSADLIDKDDIIKISLLGILSGENIVLLGPPGTAKSRIARKLSQIIDNNSYFEYLLTKYTTPEELFGPLSILKLKNDEFKRNVEGYLPVAKIAFLDEIFKANSSILNSLLTIINEKKYHNGKEEMDVPLVSLIGASNEFPKLEELKALYDRFLLKMEVTYVDNEERKKLFTLKDKEYPIPENLKLTFEEIKKIQDDSINIILPSNIIKIIEKIIDYYEKSFDDKNKNIEKVSDRRIVKISRLMRVSAYTNGRKKVDISDIFLLKYCLWNDPQNKEKLDLIMEKVIKEEMKNIF